MSDNENIQNFPVPEEETVNAPAFPTTTSDGLPVDIKALCKADVKKHLTEIGHGGWEPLIQKWCTPIAQGSPPPVNVRTFWRYVAVERGRIANSRETPDPNTVRQAIIHMSQRARSAAIRQHIPHPPSPAILAGEGAEGRRKLDFLIQIDSMLSDVESLRSWAMRVDDDGGEQVHNPLYFEKAISRRAEILTLAISAYKALWDVKKMQELYDAVIDEVSKVDPETGRRILEALRLLDDERGLTLNARVA